MKRYFVGIDGGGTKTTAKASYQDGAPLFQLYSGPLNPCSTETGIIKQTICDLFEEIARRIGNDSFCSGVCIGTAGFGNPDTASILTRIVQSVVPCKRIIITSDAHTALYGALENHIGLILIAGTGSICYGMNAAGESWRSGGDGHLLGDEGSGFTIGREILTAVLKSLDGRMPETSFIQLLADEKGLSDREEILSFVYNSNEQKKAIASVAPLLTQACMLGDKTANDIAKMSALGLLQLVIPVVCKLGLQNSELAFSGSILLNEKNVSEILVKELKCLYPKLLIKKAKKDAAEGALRLAME